MSVNYIVLVSKSSNNLFIIIMNLFLPPGHSRTVCQHQMNTLSPTHIVVTNMFAKKFPVHSFSRHRATSVFTWSRVSGLPTNTSFSSALVSSPAKCSTVFTCKSLTLPVCALKWVYRSKYISCLAAAGNEVDKSSEN